MTTATAEVRSGVATLRWDRADVHNAMDSVTASELESQLRQLRARDDVGAVLLYPAPGAFCAGWDLAELRAVIGQGAAEQRAFLSSNLALLDALRDSSQITVAVIDGACLGFGAALACCCDLRIATERSTFGFPEAPLGIVPAMAALEVVPELSAGQAISWLAVGRTRTAEAAARAGLVDEVVGEGDLPDVLEELRHDLAAVRPAVLRETKRLVHELRAGGDPGEHRRVAIEFAAASLAAVAAHG